MRVLILGAAGMMGHMAARVLSDGHEVIGSIRASTPSPALRAIVPDDRLVTGVDATQHHAMVRLMADVHPDVVFNCIGIVKQLDTAKDAILSLRANSLYPHELADLCAAAGAHLIHMSTDCVFSGDRGMYTLQDNPDPVDLYGRTKLLGEVAAPHATTLRTSIVGRQLGSSTGLFEWVRSQRGRDVSGYQGAIYTGLTTMALARIVGRLIDEGTLTGGLWQVASAPVTKLELVHALNDRLDLGMNVSANTTFRCDRSMDGSAFTEATGITVPSWDEMLDEFAADEAFYAGLPA
ncbi:MAG: SDR family oxidoreductase [Thermoleophilia bacterium]